MVMSVAAEEMTDRTRVEALVDLEVREEILVSAELALALALA